MEIPTHLLEVKLRHKDAAFFSILGIAVTQTAVFKEAVDEVRVHVAGHVETEVNAYSEIQRWPITPKTFMYINPPRE